MKDFNKVITLISTDEIQQKLKLECFRLELHHEYKIGGETIKIDKPLAVECVMPVDEIFGLPTYNKREIIRMLSEKLIADMRGEGE